jgi:hypothetical protein
MRFGIHRYHRRRGTASGNMIQSPENYTQRHVLLTEVLL